MFGADTIVRNDIRILPALLEKEDSGLTLMMRELGRMLLDIWNRTEATIEQMNDRLKCFARESDLCRRLLLIGVAEICVCTTLNPVRFRTVFFGIEMALCHALKMCGFSRASPFGWRVDHLCMCGIYRHSSNSLLFCNGDGA